MFRRTASQSGTGAAETADFTVTRIHIFQVESGADEARRKRMRSGWSAK